MSDFDSRLRTYRLAKADLDRHQYGAVPEGRTAELAWEKETHRLAVAHGDALDTLLLTKVWALPDLLAKLEIIVAAEVYDNWHLNAAIMALAVDDARHLIGGASHA